MFLGREADPDGPTDHGGAGPGDLNAGHQAADPGNFADRSIDQPSRQGRQQDDEIG